MMTASPSLMRTGKPEMETVLLERPIMRGAHVFNGEQVDDMPPLDLTDKAYEWDPVEKAESILAASGAVIKHDQSDRAFYRPRTDSIHLPPRENFEEPGRYYGTALHELGHWTGHSSRMKREFGPFGSEVYAKEELRAEIASWMLGEDLGIPHEPGQHASYVQSWVKALKEDPYEIVRACRDAEQIKGYVMGLEQRKDLAQEQTMQNRTDNRSPHHEEGIAAMEAPANPAKEKTFLNVPYTEKEKVKALGAKWDRTEKSWYIPAGVDQTPFEKWQDPHQEAFNRISSMNRNALVAETTNQLALHNKSTFELKLLSDRLQDELTAARKDAKGLKTRFDEAVISNYGSLDEYHAARRVDGHKRPREVTRALDALDKAERTVISVSGAYEGTLRTLLLKQELEKGQEQKWRDEISAAGDRLAKFMEEINQGVDPARKEYLQKNILVEQKLIDNCWSELAKLKVLPDPAKALEKPLQLNPQEEFAKALADAGLDLHGELPSMDGTIHRVPLLGDKPGTLNGAYLGHADGVPNGWADNFKTGERVKWVANGHTLTDAEKARMREDAMRRKEERARELAAKQDIVAAQCKAFYESSPPAQSDHAYLVKKGISADAFRVSPISHDLMVPLTNAEGEIRSLQYISEDGSKRFVPGGQKKDCFCLLGADINQDEKCLASGEILLAEGVATGASLQVATGKPVAVAFDAGNLEAVAVKLREKFPKAAITICADNDYNVTRNDTLYNVGVEKAKTAAQRVGGRVKVPEFTKEEKDKGLTDFNDLHKARGLWAVRRQVGDKSLARDSRDTGLSL